MAVNFFQNGSSLGSTAGWGGYTGSTNYVVRYSFTTGSSGASAVTLYLNSIYTQKGSGGQTWGFKISTSSTAYANARAIDPDSNSSGMSFSSSWGCTLTASGLNLSPSTTYYLFVYITSSGTEYYAGTWNCTDPTIETSGSYTPTSSSIASVTDPVITQNAVTIQMNNPGGLTHTCSFYYGSTLLATSGSFTSTLSFTCPRSWFSNAPASTQISIKAVVTSSTGNSESRSFTLTADNGMVPVITNAVSIAPVNENSRFTDYISNVSQVAVTLTAGSIDWSAEPGAELRKMTISYNGVSSSKDTTVSYTLNTGTITGSGSVTCTVTDSRGRTGSTTVSFTAVSYVEPYLSSYSAVRCGSDGTASSTGSYYKVKAVSVCESLNGKNAATITYAIKTGSGDYGSETNLASNTEVLTGGSLVPSKTYTVRFTVTDTVGKSKSYTVMLAYQTWAMKFNSTGTGVAFGKDAETDKCLEIASGWKFKANEVELDEYKLKNAVIVLPSGTDGLSFGTELPSVSWGTGHLFFLLES